MQTNDLPFLWMCWGWAQTWHATWRTGVSPVLAHELKGLLSFIVHFNGPTTLKPSIPDSTEESLNSMQIDEINWKYLQFAITYFYYHWTAFRQKKRSNSREDGKRLWSKWKRSMEFLYKKLSTNFNSAQLKVCVCKRFVSVAWEHRAAAVLTLFLRAAAFCSTQQLQTSFLHLVVNVRVTTCPGQCLHSWLCVWKVLKRRWDVCSFYFLAFAPLFEFKAASTDG